jgi:hypothetical protein
MDVIKYNDLWPAKEKYTKWSFMIFSLRFTRYWYNGQVKFVYPVARMEYIKNAHRVFIEQQKGRATWKT